MEVADQVENVTTLKTKKKKVKDPKKGSKKKDKDKKARSKDKKCNANGKTTSEHTRSVFKEESRNDEQRRLSKAKISEDEEDKKLEEMRKTLEAYRRQKARKGSAGGEEKKKSELGYKEKAMEKEQESKRAEEARLRIEARIKEVKEKSDAKIKAREQELLKEREENDRKVKLELEEIDQRSAQYNAWYEEQLRQQEQSKNDARDESEKRESARLLRKMQKEMAKEKDLEDAKKAAIESAHKKADEIKKEALKKQQVFEEKFAAEAVRERERDAEALSLTEEWAKHTSEQGRKLEEFVKDKECRERSAKEAAEARRIALEMVNRNEIKTAELQRQEALAAAKATIDRKADELQREATKRQQLFEEQLAESAAKSSEEETKVNNEILEDMARVAEEGKRLEEILRNKERWEQENKTRFASSTRALSSLENEEESKQTEALVAAKLKIQERRLELEEKAMQRQKLLEEELAESAAKSSEGETMDYVDSEMEIVAEEGRRLKEILQKKERWERENKDRFASSTTSAFVTLEKEEELKQNKALAAAQAKIQERRLELEEKALEKQRLLAEEMAESAAKSSEDETKDHYVDSEMEIVAEEGRRLEEILRIKERCEHEASIRFTATISTVASLENKAASEEAKALAAAKAKIQERKLELEEKAKRDQQSATDQSQKHHQEVEKEQEEIDCQTHALEEQFLQTQCKLRQIEASAKTSFIIPRAA